MADWIGVDMHHRTARRRAEITRIRALLHPVRHAEERGRMEERERIIEQLRAQAALHVGLPGDGHRRKELNSFADALRDGRGPGRRRG